MFFRLLNRLAGRPAPAAKAVRPPGRRRRRLSLESLETRRVLAPVADIVDITPDPRSAVVGEVEIRFTDSVSGNPTDVTGVSESDFRLTRGTTEVSLTAATLSGSGSSYFLNLSAVPQQIDGTYTLELRAAGSGITDSSSAALAANASDTWALDLAPTADIADITPDPRNTNAGSVAINFSESVTGVTISDFKLTRGGVDVPLTANMLTGTGASYSLNLTTVTASAGTYVLTLTAAGSGITDATGNALAANATDSWIVETNAPTADIIDVTPDPRRTPVGTVAIMFDEPVTGVDLADFRLTRNGVNVPLTGVTFSGSGANYTLDLSTVAQPLGDYTLTLVAANSGIRDAAGNALAANASDGWSFDDEREQNDTLQTASDLGRLKGAVAISNLVLADANDWFRFTTTTKGTAKDKIVLRFSNAGGNLDIELYNVAGQRLRSSITNGDSETISLNGLKSGTYHIRVFGRAGATNDSYELSINYRGTAPIHQPVPGKAPISNVPLRVSNDFLGLIRFGEAPAGGRPVRK